MATATKTRRTDQIDCKPASRRGRPLDSTWKPSAAYIIALTFDDGSEKAYVFLYSRLRQAQSDARWFVREDPFGDGIVAARVRRIASMSLDDPKN
jgi:hypothetical protein